MTSNDITISAPSLSWLHRTVRCFSGFSDFLDQKGIDHPFDAEQLADIEQKLSTIAQDMITKCASVGGQFDSASKLIESDEERYGPVTIPKNGDWRVSITGNIKSEEWQDMCRLAEMAPNEDGTLIHADGVFLSYNGDHSEQEEWLNQKSTNAFAKEFIDGVRDELKLIIM